MIRTTTGFSKPLTGSLSDYPPLRGDTKKDRDGDIVTTGMLVNLEKTKTHGLCFNCGKKGHQTKNCRFEDGYKAKQREVTAALEGLHVDDLDTDESEEDDARNQKYR